MRRHVTAKTIVRVSHLLHLPMMPDRSIREIELLRSAYAAFNARDIDAALALMAPDVTWPRAFKGGFVRGPEEIRAYWTQQWSEIDGHVEPVAFHTQDAGQILVDVHQVVRDLAGAVLASERVGHRFTIEAGLIQAMEVCSLPSSSQVIE
jgi:ketosteroid isomerase-like protein